MPKTDPDHMCGHTCVSMSHKRGKGVKSLTQNHKEMIGVEVAQ